MNGPPLGAMANAFDAEGLAGSSDRVRELIARRERLLGPAYRLFYREPLHVVRGEGVWLFDADGRRYLDAYNNVASVGHCHPRVTDALCSQARTLNTHTRYLHDGILNYAGRLLAHFPADIAHVMLTCSGSEANDLAVRVSKAFTGGEGIIVTECAYHGVTEAMSQVSPALGTPRGHNVRTVPAPARYCTDVDNLGETFAREVQRAIDDLRFHGVKLAAFLCDTVFSSDGIHVGPPGFLAQAVCRVHEAGGLFIADEVQAGFGRTGSFMWGFERHHVMPDIVTLGKPMANGHPVAAAVMRPEVVAEFGRKTRYFNTFAGNPVSCAAALATLEVIEDERLMENAGLVGGLLSDLLRDLRKSHPCIGEVRGAGLCIGVELVRQGTETSPDTALASDVVNDLRRRGILISATGRHANVLKIRPPLVFTSEQARFLVSMLGEVLGSLR